MSEPTAAPSTMLVLKSKDGEKVEVEREVALQMNYVKGMLDDEKPNLEIPVEKVDARILAKVVEYCKYHHLPGRNTQEMERWENEFVSVDKSTLFELILAANFLGIEPILDLTSKTVANMIKGKTPDQILETFGITNDFTPEELEEIRRDNEHFCGDGD